MYNKAESYKKPRVVSSPRHHLIKRAIHKPSFLFDLWRKALQFKIRFGKIGIFLNMLDRMQEKG